MRTAAMPTQFIKSLGDGACWIHGVLQTPVTGVQGPMILGAGWMLEMVRVANGARTLGLFLAPFGIVTFDVPEFKIAGKADFVGLSMTSE